MNIKKNTAFTLIELLVVVLIIGILAAVALPQYEQAEMKARWATMLPVVRSLKDAFEVFYMSNGYYDSDTSVLDVQHSCSGTNILVCPGGFLLDNFSGKGIISNPNDMYIRFFYCPGLSSWSACEAQAEYYYTVWMDHSNRFGERSCVGLTDKGRRFCKNIENL